MSYDGMALVDIRTRSKAQGSMLGAGGGLEV